ncbi:MAG: histidine--tRNA ligase [Bacteroidales bacterium]|nr:histidine--tRNA ligase [Bacteroidales bacterium]
MAQKTSIPKGTRDFSSAEMARRNYIFDTIKGVFARFGYSQIETPAMENLGTLLGKYGEEGDKLLYRIQNSGEKAALAPEKGLRYDLTVPFARFVVQHRGELSFPFKRFQIQPVWRADRPQKGRYREFYQCDADVIGSRSQLCELELVQMVEQVFAALDIRVLLKINNRKLLTGLAEICGFPERVVDITVAIDKIDKIGLEAVEAEMMEKGLSADAVAVLRPILLAEGDFSSKMDLMRGLMNGGSASGIVSQEGLRGLDEIDELFGLISAAGVKLPAELDLSLARGLNYYTGAIFEVKALDWQIGSICGGGRYDNLTGIFGLPDVSGVGISFGADRIYDVLCGLEKYPAGLESGAQLLFANMGTAEVRSILPLAAALRSEGISTEVYPESGKLKKQFDYAQSKGIAFISINGENEIAAGTINIKNLSSGEQKSFPATDTKAILEYLRG